MKYTLVIFSLILLTNFVDRSSTTYQSPTTDLQDSLPNIIYHKNFPSKYVDSRNVEVWLPPDYDTVPDKKFKVLYMHDGQNLFNPKTSYGGVDWGIDEVMDSLIKNYAIKSTVVVAIWNNGAKRFNEYMPKAPTELTENQMTKDALKQNTGFGALYSDDYLSFIVEELKPFIDSNYNVSEKPEDTAIMGSSMGGLISLYAICKYPDVFGNAGCISTHWPIPVLGDAFIASLPSTLPNPENHKIYFDYGTKSLDSLYEPYQLKVDEIMKKAGYNIGHNFISKKFDGASHNEKSWHKRVYVPLEFLLK